LHELDRKSEQSTRFVSNHLEVVIFTWACQSVSPEEVHPLASVKIDHLFNEYIDSPWVAEFRYLLQGEKVDIVG
jgi:hypothetical protein